MWQFVASTAANALLGAYSSGTDIKVAKERSKTAQVQLARGISQLNLQRAQTRQQTSTALFNVQNSRQQSLSQVGLQAAAGDVVGGSVQDAVATVNLSSDRQTAAVNRQQSDQEQAFFQQAETLIQNSSTYIPKSTAGSALFNAALSASGQYLGSKGADAVLGDALDFNYSEWGSKVASGIQSWKTYLSDL